MNEHDEMPIDGRDPQPADQPEPLAEPLVPWAPDPDLPPERVRDILARRAEELARPLPQKESGTVRDLLVFLLNGERYGIEVTQVREIYPYQPLTAVPRTPDFVLGLFSARGRLISVLDLRQLLGLAAQEPAPDSKLIVAATENMKAAFLVDQVEDVLPVYDKEIVPALSAPAFQSAPFIHGVAPGLLAVLDLKTLFNQPELLVREEL